MVEMLKPEAALPIGGVDKRTNGRWGVMALITTEASLFGYLLFTYFYLASQTERRWPPEGLPSLMMPGVNTLILLSSSVFVWACERSIQRSRLVSSLAWLGLANGFGICFVVIQLKEWGKKKYDMTSDLYGSLYFTITGFHMLHVVIGLVILMTLLVWIKLGYLDAKRYSAVSIGGLYWHFVDVVWLFVFTSLYLLPYLS